MKSNQPDPAVQSSPQTYARIGGVLYLIVIVLGLMGEVFIRGKLVVSGDAAATAARVGYMESLWRFGIASEFFLLICAAGTTWVFYVLLRPVSQELALLGVLINGIAIAVEAAAGLHLIMALFPLGDAEYLQAFGPQQRHALVMLSIRAHAYGFGVSLLFFGCACVIFGYLIARSGYLPTPIGALYQIAGGSYVILGFALILAPAFADRIFPALAIPAFIGETSTALWLLVKGVNVESWRRRGLVSAAPGA